MEENYSKLVDIAYNMHISKNFDEAKTVYEKLLSIKPDDINVLYLYAQLNTNLGNYDTAIELFTKLYKKTKFEDSLVNIAKVYMHKKEYSLALKTLEAIRLKDIVVIKLTALCYLQTDDYKKAIEFYELVCSSGSASFADYFNLSLSYYNINEFDKALISAHNALKLNESNYEIHLHLANIYSSLSEFQNEIIQLEQALNINYSIETLYKIANSYLSQKLYRDAIKYFYKILTIDSDNKAVKDKIKEIENDLIKNEF